MAHWSHGPRGQRGIVSTERLVESSSTKFFFQIGGTEEFRSEESELQPCFSSSHRTRGKKDMTASLLITTAPSARLPKSRHNRNILSGLLHQVPSFAYRPHLLQRRPPPPPPPRWFQRQQSHSRDGAVNRRPGNGHRLGNDGTHGHQRAHRPPIMAILSHGLDSLFNHWISSK